MMLNIFPGGGSMAAPRTCGRIGLAISRPAFEEGFMSKSETGPLKGCAATRREMLARGAAGVAVLFARAGRVEAQQGMAEKHSAGDEARITALHQELEFNAEPHRIYEILLDSKQFAAFTGRAAEISPVAGGAFKMFGGLIEGRNVELVPDVRIVQAWRPASWDPGVYSIVEFQLKAQAGGTHVILDHKGFPEGDFAHLDPGWHLQYWTPLGKYLGS
jgi:activator of HSP90 ATPase